MQIMYPALSVLYMRASVITSHDTIHNKQRKYSHSQYVHSQYVHSQYLLWKPRWWEALQCTGIFDGVCVNTRRIGQT